jgi:hypothetical protein
VSAAESRASGTVRAEPAAVWALWEDPGRWPEWNERIAAARAAGPLSLGAKARVRFRGSPAALPFTIVAWEPGRSFTDAGRLGPLRLTHEHLVEPDEAGARITHVLALRGPGARVAARLLRFDASVETFVAAERRVLER